MFGNLIEKFKGWALSVASRKAGLMAANLLASGRAAAWMTAKASPYLIQYGPTLDKFGMHITPEVFFISVCGLLATLLHDAYGVTQQNKEEGTK